MVAAKCGTRNIRFLVVMKRESIGWQLMDLHLNMCFTKFNFRNLFDLV